jgi:hypothetical protein
VDESTRKFCASEGHTRSQMSATGDSTRNLNLTF